MSEPVAEATTVAVQETSDRAVATIESALAAFGGHPDWSDPQVRAIIRARLAGETYPAIATATGRSLFYVWSVCQRVTDGAGVSASDLAHSLTKARLADHVSRAAISLSDRAADEPKAVDANRLVFAVDRAISDYLDLTEGRRGVRAGGPTQVEVRLVQRGVDAPDD